MNVSVIVPNYNHAPFLKRRLDTILKQTRQDFELIILDDASTDHSREIIEAYRGHEKVTLIHYNDANSGSAFRQWQKGIAMAKGEWIWIAEADDYCEPGFLEELMTAVVGHENAVLAFTQSYCVEDNGKVQWQSNYEGPDVVNGVDLFRQRFVYGCMVFNASMAIFNRRAALKVPSAYSGFRQCGDWYFWIHLSIQGDVCISKELLNYYRRTATSLTSISYATGAQYTEELRMFDLLLKELPEASALIKSSVYNRYNSFRRKRTKLDAAVVVGIMDRFYAFFHGKRAFMAFVCKKDIERLARKIKARLKTI